MDQIEDDDSKRPYKVSLAMFPGGSLCMFHSSSAQKNLFFCCAINNSCVLNDKRNENNLITERCPRPDCCPI